MFVFDGMMQIKKVRIIPSIKSRCRTEAIYGHINFPIMRRQQSVIYLRLFEIRPQGQDFRQNHSVGVRFRSWISDHVIHVKESTRVLTIARKQE